MPWQGSWTLRVGEAILGAQVTCKKTKGKGYVSRLCVMHSSSIRAQGQGHCWWFCLLVGLIEPLISDWLILYLDDKSYLGSSYCVQWVTVFLTLYNRIFCSDLVKQGLDILSTPYQVLMMWNHPNNQKDNNVIPNVFFIVRQIWFTECEINPLGTLKWMFLSYHPN